MKINLTLFFLLCSILGFSQKVDTSRVKETVTDKTTVKGWASGHGALSFQFGVYSFDYNGLNNQLFNESNNRLSDNNFIFGVSMSVPAETTRGVQLDSHLDIQFLGPKLHRFSDSLSFATGGFYIGFDFCQDLFPKVKWYDFLVGVGFNAGRMKLSRKDLSISNDFLKYTNPFFSPKVIVEQRLFFGKFSISVKGELLFDVTNSKWKRKDDLLPSITGSKATGYILTASIGVGS